MNMPAARRVFDRGADRLMVEADLGCDGPELPALAVEQAPDLGALRGRDHRSSLCGSGPLGAREGAGDIAAGRIERSARPLPVAGAGLDQAAQRLVCGAAPRAVLDGHLIARQADRAVDVADGTGPASSTTPHPAADPGRQPLLHRPRLDVHADAQQQGAEPQGGRADALLPARPALQPGTGRGARQRLRGPRPAPVGPRRRRAVSFREHLGGLRRRRPGDGRAGAPGARGERLDLRRAVGGAGRHVRLVHAARGLVGAAAGDERPTGPGEHDRPDGECVPADRGRDRDAHAPLHPAAARGTGRADGGLRGALRPDRRPDRAPRRRAGGHPRPGDAQRRGGRLLGEPRVPRSRQREERALPRGRTPAGRRGGGRP